MTRYTYSIYLAHSKTGHDVFRLFRHAPDGIDLNYWESGLSPEDVLRISEMCSGSGFKVQPTLNGCVGWTAQATVELNDPPAASACCFCEECGEGILDDSWHIVRGTCGEPLTICDDCFAEPPEPVTRAAQPREV